MYDFVNGAQDPAILNQMAAFQSVMDNLTQPLTGTVVRIPLRTRKQADKSEISSKETTVAEIRSVLHKFAANFGDSGLLFMRNVTKLSILSTAGMSVSIEMDTEDGIKK